MSSLNIGFDAKRAFYNKTGLGNYSRSLISALDTNYPNNKYYLFTKNTGNSAFNNWSKKLNNTSIINPEGMMVDAAWRSFIIPSLLNKNDINIYHGLSAELPIGNKPKNTKYIVTIHDLIFLRYPKLYSFVDRNIYYQKTLHACRIADRIIAISEQTKADIIQYFKIPEDKISVVYQTCDPIFEKKIDDITLQNIKNKYQLPNRYLLNVGTLEERKNALIILKSLTKLPEDIHAVFVGKSTSYQVKLDQFISEHHLTNRVHFLQNISFEELPAIYQLATVFIYPSRFEGFGIPMLEAIKSGVPAIGAVGSTLEEAGGYDCFYINPDDTYQLTNYIFQILNDSSLTNSMIQAGLEYGEQFSYSQFATDTLNVYLS